MAAPVVSEAFTPRGEVAVYDCWNKIGVNGDSTCRELEKFVHCRNCPVYSSAGTRLLDRDLPANYRRQWTELFSRKKPVVTPGKVSIVIFRLGAEWLALPTQVFQEVVSARGVGGSGAPVTSQAITPPAEQRTIHSLPHRRQGIVLGLTNIRGELLICVSIGRLLGLEREVKKEKTRTIYDRLMVVQWNNNRLVFPVDEVHGIQRYHPGELKEVPATLAKNLPGGVPAITSRGGANYSRGIFSWRNKSVGCLDEELLFYTLNRSLT